MSRDSDERISLSEEDVLDEDSLQPVNTPSSTPPPPPKEALQHVVVPRLAPVKSDSLAPPKLPSDPPPDPELTTTGGPSRAANTNAGRAALGAKADDEEDDRDVVDIRWVLAAAVLMAVLIGTWALARGREPGVVAPIDPSRVALTLTGVPAGAQVELDGQTVSGTELSVHAGARHAVEVEAPGHTPWRQVFITHGALELVVQLETAPPPAARVPPAAEPVVAPAPSADPSATEPAVAPEPEVEPAVEPEPAAPTRSGTSGSTATRPASHSSGSSSSSTSHSTPERSTTMRSSNTLVRNPGF